MRVFGCFGVINTSRGAKHIEIPPPPSCFFKVFLAILGTQLFVFLQNMAKKRGGSQERWENRQVHIARAQLTKEMCNSCSTFMIWQ